MRNYIIRKARTDDIDSIIKLLYQVHDVHANIRPDLFIKGKKKYSINQLKNILTDNLKPIFVYEENDNVCGYCFCIIEENENDGSRAKIKTLYIDDLCVDEKYRKQGIGKRLFEYTKNYAKECGCYSITLNVWEGNDVAKKFYESIGFKTLKTTLENII